MIKLVSVVIPVFNEEKSLGKLYQELLDALKTLPYSYEILLVDDGSVDDSISLIEGFCAIDKNVKAILLKKNFGQTSALMAGINSAKGDIIVTMDADLQNDPRDIPALIKKMEEGYDLASGWRKKRNDLFFRRRLPSILANWAISRLTGLRLHDFGCTLKAYRAQYLKNITLFGEMHRFIPVYVSSLGGKITEIEVNHRARVYGISKYGMERTIKVACDLLTVKFLMGNSSTSPLYVFGKWGFTLIAAGIICAVTVLMQKLFWGFWAHKNPLLLLAIFFVLMGTQAIFMGLIAELNIRIYYESNKKNTYVINRMLNG